MKKANKKDSQTIVKLSYGMSGKMLNVLGISTSCLDNPRCSTYRKCPGAICNDCFAAANLEFRKEVREAMHYNMEALSKREFTREEIAAIAIEVVAACRKNNTNMFRIESFGDIANTIHASNYIRLAAAVYFLDQSILMAWWTKNPNYLVAAFQGMDDTTRKLFRAGCNVVLLSLFKGVPFPEKARKKIEAALGMEVLTFTVYDVKDTDPIVNCGARSCFNCRRCYLRENRGDDVIEALK